MRLLLAATLLATTPAMAAKITVNAQDNIYGAGQTSAPGGGNVPTGIVKLGTQVQCVTVTRVTGSLACSSPEGCIVLNTTSGNTPNDPDGTGAATGSSSNTGAASISGITAPNAGYLVALFTKTQGPEGAAPASLDFTTGAGTGFTTLSPLLDQTFFVGDGRVADDAGAKQTFVVPAGAKKLYFGISDACNYNGAPGCYDDNAGAFTVAVKLSKTACP